MPSICTPLLTCKGTLADLAVALRRYGHPSRGVCFVGSGQTSTAAASRASGHHPHGHSHAGDDGVSLTHRLKASPHLAAIPVIMWTGDSRKEALASAAAFVAKPFTRELLTAKLKKVLRR